ncbi:MAG TPA: hypothetical protein VKY85_26190 [Candidatus Angelobacter sp.]|nr:hypothetical protein [Candidatus Angelobacter sp.]
MKLHSCYGASAALNIPVEWQQWYCQRKVYQDGVDGAARLVETGDLSLSQIAFASPGADACSLQLLA